MSEPTPGSSPERGDEITNISVGAARVVVEEQVADCRTSDFVDEPMLMTFPHLLVRECVAFLGLSIFLVVMSLCFDAPLEAIADPTRTPNPAKAPWYFLGMQELLQYYPPIVAGVLFPALLIIALAIIPYFRVNIERPPLWKSAPWTKVASLWAVVAGLSGVFYFTGSVPIWSLMVPLWIVGLAMSAGALPWRHSRLGIWLQTRSLAFWIFAWFLLAATTLTVIGLWFRGPGWRFTLPWHDGFY